MLPEMATLPYVRLPSGLPGPWLALAWVLYRLRARSGEPVGAQVDNPGSPLGPRLWRGRDCDRHGGHGDHGAWTRRPLSNSLHCGVRQGAGSLVAGGLAVHACARRIGGVHGRLWPSSPAPDSTRPPVVREAGGPRTIGRAVSATHTLPRGIAA